MVRRRDCRLRVYAYPWLKGPISSILHTAHLWNRFGLSAQRRSCLVDTCLHDSFDSKSNVLTYTAEALLWKAVLERCPIVTEPAEAHVFLVPFWIGTTITMGWGSEGFRTPELAGWLNRLQQPAELQRWLPHLANYSRKHIFLSTTDSQFVHLGAQGSTPGIERDAIWVHLGDDHWTAQRSAHSLRLADGRHLANGWHLANDVTVPYRVAHWLPFGFPPPEVPKRHLLFSSTNQRKHKSRALLHAALRNRSATMGIENRRMRLYDALLPVRTAAAEALRSTFCLCPTSDSKGFTAVRSRECQSCVHGTNGLAGLRASSPHTPSPRTPSPRTPSPRTPAPRTPSLRTPSLRTPSPHKPSPLPLHHSASTSPLCTHASPCASTALAAGCGTTRSPTPFRRSSTGSASSSMPTI